MGNFFRIAFVIDYSTLPLRLDTIGHVVNEKILIVVYLACECIITCSNRLSLSNKSSSTPYVTLKSLALILKS
jgi:hypothetical protein